MIKSILNSTAETLNRPLCGDRRIGRLIHYRKLKKIESLDNPRCRSYTNRMTMALSQLAKPVKWAKLMIFSVTKLAIKHIKARQKLFVDSFMSRPSGASSGICFN